MSLISAGLGKLQALITRGLGGILTGPEPRPTPVDPPEVAPTPVLRKPFRTKRPQTLSALVVIKNLTNQELNSSLNLLRQRRLALAAQIELLEKRASRLSLGLKRARL